MTLRLNTFYKNRYKNLPKDWAFIRLGDLFIERKEKSTDITQYPLHSLLIDGGIVQKEERYERSFLQKDKENNEYRLVYPDDIVFNPMNLRFGAIAKSNVQFTVAVSAYYNVLSLKNKTNDIDFLIELLQSDFMVDLYDRLSIGSLIEKRRVHLSIFNDIIIPLPPEKEQRKISKILGAWSNAINYSENLVYAKQELKRGLMQQLLTGNVRFKEYSLSKEWDTLEFEKIATKSSKKFDPQSSTENLPCIELEHIEQETGRLLGHVSALEQKSIKNRFVAGQVLFGKLRPYLKKYTKPDFDGVCSSEVWVLSGRQGVCNNNFLFYLVQSHRFISISNVSSGSKMPRADWDYVAESVYPIPSLPEQIKIAHLLELVDKSILLLTEKLNNLRKQKAGLIQKLLVGQIRVKI